MTTIVKFTHVHGNKAVELVGADGLVYATLDAPGRSFEVLVHGDVQITARETGPFFGAPSTPEYKADATVNEAQAATSFENEAKLPPGAGEDGSNVPDTRVD